jgi:hypothetical protein
MDPVVTEGAVFMKALITAVALAMALGTGAGAVDVFAAQTAGQEAKKAGEKAKDAAKDTGGAATHAGKATAKAATTGAKKVKKAVTGDAHATCVDGTRQAAETEAAAAAACKEHGGVKKS